MSGLPPSVEKELNEMAENKKLGGKIPRSYKVYASKILHDANRAFKNFISIGHIARLRIMLVPLLLIGVVAFVIYLPGAAERTQGSKLNVVRVENPSLSLVYETDREGHVTSAWLRTPKTSRRIGQLDGLAYIADSRFYADVDGDEKDDLLWRISFNSEQEKAGVHLWIGVLSGRAKIYVCSSPYEYTRWDAVPTKIRTPKSCALYVSPSIPGTEFKSKDCYSFIYTIKLTPEGPAFVPIPRVYKDLFPILRAAADIEQEPALHKAYIKMLLEFKNLSEGKIPSVDTLTNLKIDDIDLIPLK